MADYSCSALHWTVEEALSQCLSEIRSGSRSPNSVVVIELEERDDDAIHITVAGASRTKVAGMLSRALHYRIAE